MIAVIANTQHDYKRFVYELSIEDRKKFFFVSSIQKGLWKKNLQK